MQENPHEYVTSAEPSTILAEMESRKQALAQHLKEKDELKANATAKSHDDKGRLLDFSLHQPSVLLDSVHLDKFRDEEKMISKKARKYRQRQADKEAAAVEAEKLAEMGASLKAKAEDRAAAEKEQKRQEDLAGGPEGLKKMQEMANRRGSTKMALVAEKQVRPRSDPSVAKRAPLPSPSP